MSQEIEEFKFYPIQATSIGVRELYIKAFRPPTLEVKMDESNFNLTIGHSTYDATEKSIQINVLLSIGENKAQQTEPESDTETDTKTDTKTETDLPFHMRVELVGFFQVDESAFPAERIYEWAKSNAIFIMYPFLREHVFALSARIGFRPLLLPLVILPTFKIQDTQSPGVATQELPATLT